MREPLPVLNNSSPDTDSSPHRPLGIWMAVSIALCCGLATYLLVRSDPLGERYGNLPPGFQLDLQKQWTVDPRLSAYRQQSQLELALGDARAIASGPNDQIYVAGKQATLVLNSDGQPVGEIAMESAAMCVAVGGEDHFEPGRVYVGTSEGIAVFDSNHHPLATWPRPNTHALITAIAVAQQDVFLADAGNRLVWRYNTAGEQLGQIGQSAGFVIHSPHFDVVVAAEDLLYVVNPGKLKIDAFTFAGDLGASWGQAGSSIDRFFGCCNPTHLAILPSGQLVTSEQGIPRVKVYDSATGSLDSVVAAPEQLGVSQHSVSDPRLEKADFDIAADSRGRVLVLDRRRNAIRVFVNENTLEPRGAQP